MANRVKHFRAIKTTLAYLFLKIAHATKQATSRYQPSNQLSSRQTINPEVRKVWISSNTHKVEKPVSTRRHRENRLMPEITDSTSESSICFAAAPNQIKISATFYTLAHKYSFALPRLTPNEQPSPLAATTHVTVVRQRVTCTFFHLLLPFIWISLASL